MQSSARARSATIVLRRGFESRHASSLVECAGTDAHPQRASTATLTNVIIPNIRGNWLVPPTFPVCCYPPSVRELSRQQRRSDSRCAPYGRNLLEMRELDRRLDRSRSIALDMSKVHKSSNLLDGLSISRYANGTLCVRDAYARVNLCIESLVGVSLSRSRVRQYARRKKAYPIRKHVRVAGKK